jgi:hypothetical protein
MSYSNAAYLSQQRSTLFGSDKVLNPIWIGFPKSPDGLRVGYNKTPELVYLETASGFYVGSDDGDLLQG